MAALSLACSALCQHQVINNRLLAELGSFSKHHLACTGASAIPYDLGPIDIGKARRTGQAVSPSEDRQGFPQAQFAPDVGATTNGNGAAAVADAPAAASGAASGNGATTSMSMESQVFNNMEFG